MNILLCLFLFFQLREFRCLDTVPVLIVDTGGVNILAANVGNPFSKMTELQFSEIVKAVVAKASTTLIFVEKELSVEDLTKKDIQGTPFKAFLHEMVNNKNVIYLPAVKNPYNILTLLLPQREENTVDIGSAKKSSSSFKDFLFYYILFEPTPLTVEKRLIHDLSMRAIVRVASESTNGSTVVIYTGVKNPVSILSTDYPEIKKVDQSSLFVASHRALFRLNIIFEQKAIKKTLNIEQLPSVKAEVEIGNRKSGDSKLLTTLSFTDFDLKFEFSLKRYEWILENIYLMEADVEVGRSALGVGAVWKSSYHCAEPLRIINRRDGSAVTLNRYQWQPSRISCELSKEGCKEIDLQRARIKFPASTIQDIEKNKMYGSKHSHHGKGVSTKGEGSDSINKKNDKINIDLTDKDKKKKHPNDPNFLLTVDKKVTTSHTQKDKNKQEKDTIKQPYQDSFEETPKINSKYPFHGPHKNKFDLVKNISKYPIGDFSKDFSADISKYPYSNISIVHSKGNFSHVFGSISIKHLEYPFGNYSHNIKDISKFPFGNISNFPFDVGSIDPSKYPFGVPSKDNPKFPLEGYPEDITIDWSKYPFQFLPNGTFVDGTQSKTDGDKPPVQNPEFGSSINCGPYFSHEILSCLLVTFIILLMFLHGLNTMMNLKSNDSFDDAELSKQFSIAEEK